MTILTVTHRTTYRYANPVEFGDHRLMFRPRDSHDLRLLKTGLAIRPAASVRWHHDVFGNSIAVASFATKASELHFESCFRAQHYPIEVAEMPVDERARRYPFSYTADEMLDLGGTTQRHHPDPERRIDAWARSLLGEQPTTETMPLLLAMTRRIKQEFIYRRRDDPGTQDPVTTLSSRSGTCRDYALLMMEAARSLGFAARFVSGYLYDDKLIEGAGETVVGGGETHAWVQIYLPGAGWVEFDPTNALAGGKNLIRVAVTRDASQAIPLRGNFTGAPDDYLGMNVEVEVKAEPS